MAARLLCVQTGTQKDILVGAHSQVFVTVLNSDGLRENELPDMHGNWFSISTNDNEGHY